MSGAPTLLVERHGAIALLTLNRPERRNGVTVGMCVAFYEAVRDVAASDARVLVLRGAGNDFCVGADIASTPDLRFATARARFSTAFLNVGVSGDMGLAWSLDRLVGGAKARELLFFPDRFGGKEAHAMGLVNRLYEPDALHGETMALAEQLAARDPLALRLMKANCISAETLPVAEYIEVESARHLQTANRPELAKLMAKGYARRKEGSQ